MKKYIFAVGIFLSWSLFSANLYGAPLEELPDPVFALGGRDFSCAEIKPLLPDECRDVHEWIQKNLPLFATLILCERADVNLSAELTRQALADSLLIMNDEQRAIFDTALQKNKLSVDEWLTQESCKIPQQVNEAARRWYVKVHGSNNPITQEYIRNWYYRHMNLFRRTTLDPEKFWIIDSNHPENVKKILDALRQGMPPAAAAKAFGVAVKISEIMDDLQKYIDRKQVPEKDFWVINGTRYIYLMRQDARRHTYIPLDENLQRAIGNALYDALAKAILAETLKRDFPPDSLRFY